MKLAALNLLDRKDTNIPVVNTNSTTLGKALTLTFVTIGAVSIVMLVIAGLRYSISAGDKEKMATAKRMIIYTVVGIIVSASAITFVNVVLGQL